MTDREIVRKISGRLSGMHQDELTVVERQIARILIKENFLMTDDDGNIVEKVNVGMPPK